VGPRAGLDVVAKIKKNPWRCWDLNPSRLAHSLVTIPTEPSLFLAGHMRTYTILIEKLHDYGDKWKVAGKTEKYR
jgi:hypothetical protein